MVCAGLESLSTMGARDVTHVVLWRADAGMDGESGMTKVLRGPMDWNGCAAVDMDSVDPPHTHTRK